jgi:acetyl esterase/lipase
MKVSRTISRVVTTAAAMASAIASLAACSPAALLNAVIPKAGYDITSGLAYGTEARQRLDVYAPGEAVGPAPVLVFFYGGSWRNGSRENYRFIGEAFASRGYVVVIPDYRLYPEARFPVFVEDGAKALKWVERNVLQHGGDSQRVFLAGHSAGAHLAALLLFDPGYLAAVGFDRGRIVGFIGLAGPYAFDPLAYESTRAVFSTVENSDQARPIAFVDKNAPPVLLMHGLSDKTVELINAEKLAARLRKVGNDARLFAYPRRTHVGLLLSLAAPFRMRDSVHADMLAFMNRQSSQRRPAAFPSASPATSEEGAR